MGQPAVRNSDNVAQPAELAMVEHGFDCRNPSPISMTIQLFRFCFSIINFKIKMYDKIEI